MKHQIWEKNKLLFEHETNYSRPEGTA